MFKCYAILTGDDRIAYFDGIPAMASFDPQSLKEYQDYLAGIKSDPVYAGLRIAELREHTNES